MSDGLKTALMFAGLIASTAALMGIVGDRESLRLLPIMPFLTLLIMQVVFRKPAFMERYFAEAVERDKERGFFSIKNAGFALIVTSPLSFPAFMSWITSA